MRRALVIGASGGIGSALVDRLSRDHDVIGLSRSGDGLDVTDEGSVARLLGPLDPVDLCVVATGILAPPGAEPEKSLDAIDVGNLARTHAVNAIGPALVLKHLNRAPGIRVGVLTARVGSIGDNAMGGWYGYRAAKAAANQIVHTAAIEIGRRDRAAVVVALHPGTVETPFTARYPAHRKVTAKEAAGNLIDVLTRLTAAQSGGFYDYSGTEVPW